MLDARLGKDCHTARHAGGRRPARARSQRAALAPILATGLLVSALAGCSLPYRVGGKPHELTLGALSYHPASARVERVALGLDAALVRYAAGVNAGVSRVVSLACHRDIPTEPAPTPGCDYHPPLAVRCEDATGKRAHYGLFAVATPPTPGDRFVATTTTGLRATSGRHGVSSLTAGYARDTFIALEPHRSAAGVVFYDSTDPGSSYMTCNDGGVEP